MTDPTHTKEAFLASDLNPEDLQTIFDNIDDHLAFWQVMYNDAILSHVDGLPVSLAQISVVSDWLKMSSAPLYTSQGIGGARGLAYRFLNLAIKIFGSPQIQFNRKLREFLGELMFTFNEFNTQAVSQKSTVEKLVDRVRELEAENSDYRREIEILTRLISEVRADIDRLTDEHSGENLP